MIFIVKNYIDKTLLGYQILFKMIWRPLSLSELTPIKFNELTHLGL